MNSVPCKSSRLLNVVTSVRTIRDFVQVATIDAQVYLGVDRRAEPRFALATSVTATPLDMDGVPCGETFVAVTRDISAGGVSILHTEAVADDHKFLLLEFARPGREDFQVVLEVLRRRHIEPLWEIAGAFLTEDTW